MSSLVVRTQSLHLPYQWPMQTCLAVTCYRSSQQAPPIFCTTQLRFEGPSSLALTYPALSLCFPPVNDDETACHVPKYRNKLILDYFSAQVLDTTVYLVCCLHLQFLQLVLESFQLLLLRVQLSGNTNGNKMIAMATQRYHTEAFSKVWPTASITDERKSD